MIAGLIIGAVLGGTLMTVIMGALAGGTIDGLRSALDDERSRKRTLSRPADEYDWSRP